MIRAFEYLTNLAVRCPLPRGEGIRLLKIRGCRIGNRMEGKPENVRTQQPNSLSTRERAREGKQAAGLPVWQKYNPVHPINLYPKASSCRIKPNHE